MDTVNDYRARYSRSSDEDLLAIAAIDAERLTPEAQQALAEEVARRGLRPGGTLAGTPYLAIPPSAAPGIAPATTQPERTMSIGQTGPPIENPRGASSPPRRRRHSYRWSSRS